MFCRKCGTEIPDNAKFCNKCGETIRKTTRTVGTTSLKKKISFQMESKLMKWIVAALVVAATVTFASRVVLPRMNQFKGRIEFASEGRYFNSKVAFETDGKYMSVISGNDNYKGKIQSIRMEGGDLIYEVDAPEEWTSEGVAVEGMAVRIPKDAKKGEAKGSWGFTLLIDNSNDDNYLAMGRVWVFEKDGTYKDMTLMGTGEISARKGKVNEAVDLLTDKAIETMETDDNNLAARLSGNWTEEDGRYRMEYEDMEGVDYLTIEP